MRKPTWVTLSVYSEFRASHSLAGFETPHFHLWKLTLEFKSQLPLLTDRVLDLVFLQAQVAKITDSLEGKFLNDVLSFSPTSENMAEWVWDEFLKQNPTTPLTAVSICLCDLSGAATGTARVEE